MKLFVLLLFIRQIIRCEMEGSQAGMVSASKMELANLKCTSRLQTQFSRHSKNVTLPDRVPCISFPDWKDNTLPSLVHKSQFSVPWSNITAVSGTDLIFLIVYSWKVGYEPFWIHTKAGRDKPLTHCHISLQCKRIKRYDSNDAIGTAGVVRLEQCDYSRAVRVAPIE